MNFANNSGKLLRFIDTWFNSNLLITNCLFDCYCASRQQVNSLWVIYKLYKNVWTRRRRRFSTNTLLPSCALLKFLLHLNVINVLCEKKQKKKENDDQYLPKCVITSEKWGKNRIQSKDFLKNLILINFIRI